MTDLPVQAVLAELDQQLASHPAVVLQAPPGAGKTSLVPLALLNSRWLARQKIILLEPRRLAARAAAERLAQLLGEQVGQTVGYRIRLETRISAATRIEVVTEGVLQRLLQTDPELPGVGLVIFDEFHERSLEADLGLALCVQTQDYLRDDSPLKLLVMSATLDAAGVSQLLNNAPLVSSAGRQYPVRIEYGDAVSPGQPLEPAVEQAILQALAVESGSVLVFLPGTAEIRRLQQRLREPLLRYPDVDLAPLYGALELSAQRQAIAPAAAGRRKLVLATPIAETSLTIDGVNVVIDSGWCREPAFDPVSGLTRLHTRRISQASAEQRAGRAGRLQAGVCYRLWSAGQHQQLAAQGSPEILQADLAPLALQLAHWGINDPSELLWLDRPPAAALQQGRDLLVQLGGLVPTVGGWELTPHGAALASLPMHPRLAHMVLRGQMLGLAQVACQLAAILGERDILRGVEDADLSRRLAAMKLPQAEPALDKGAQQRAAKLASQWQRSLPSTVLESPVAQADSEHWAGLLLALAYPDRIAQRRAGPGSDYRLANGRAAEFAQVDSLEQQEWLVIAELGGHVSQRNARIFRAAALDPKWITTYLSDVLEGVQTLEWDPRSATLLAEQQQRIGALVYSRKPLDTIDPQQRRSALCDVVRKQGLVLLPWSPALRQWQARILLLRQLEMQTSPDQTSRWPDVSDTALLATLDSWLAPWLDPVRRLAHFAQLDLAAILATLLPWPLPQELEEQAPTHWTVPTGSRIRIDYSESPPVLAVRLQELFGSGETPRIARGQLALKLQLLSPARRPVQVTQDLAGFWTGSYAQVRKDLRGRYPKHYWPDDPLQAQPTARAKPRNR